MSEDLRSSGPRRIGDIAVQKRTGRTWKDWFALLDEAGAVDMRHTEMAKYLEERHAVSPWWCQMISNTYEQERGLRDRHQMPEGYQISVSKTMRSTAGTVFSAWTTIEARALWLGDAPIVLRRSTADRSMKFTWGEGRSGVDVNLYEKGEGKTQVVVQHSKLADTAEAEVMKSFWRNALLGLEAMLSSVPRGKE